MAKFKFSMQNLLRVKEKMEDQYRMEYGKAIQNRDLQVKKINQIKAAILGANQNFYQVQESTFQIKNLIMAQNKISFLKEEQKQATIQLNSLEEKVIQQRNKLVKAMQERKTYEILRDKALEKFYEEEKQEELKRIDERASFNYSRG